ncbi:AraC family transcriptional regulator [Glycomyces sp. YM15]|uniref:AraC family transcriptional regulator n=1 Tax=Glycomyces sp. YM15 TaxID=2800446 RepID=UPI00196488CC|nr:AraC family transcriptional regulator [Glycomyces sp. YM15]
MDPLSDMLADIRAEGAAVHRAALAPPWRLRFDCVAHDSATYNSAAVPLTMVTAVAGSAELVLHDGTKHRLTAGSTAIARVPFELADDRATLDRPIQAVAIEAAPQADRDASTVLIAGTYRPASARHQRLMRALPEALVLDEEVDDVLWLHSMRDALDRAHAPGGQAMLDRILDWGLVCTLGCWFERQEAAAPGWYRGALDPVTGPALEAVHRHPGRAWTVEALAAQAKVSRAHFAKRFTEVMAQPPLRYVTERRMELAADLLADPQVPVAAAAAAAGYRDPFAFSTAFKRHHGMSPRAYRSRRV